MFIYVVTNDVNSKCYVGLHFGSDLRKRWLEHLSAARIGLRSALHCAMRKHGVHKFHISSLWSGTLSTENLKLLERFFIKSLKTKSPVGYNTTDGGDGTIGYRHSEEEKRIRSERMKGNISLWTGRKRSPEIGRRISTAKRGKKRGPQSPEWRAKISASLIGNKRSLGHKWSADSIAKRTATRAEKVNH
jgi:group I intron endonuclease